LREEPDLLEIGAIAKPHGLKGEVIVSLVTDRTERLDPGNVLHTDRGPLTVVEARPHQHRWRVRFEGFHTREEADVLHGLVLLAEPIDDPDTWFVHDLIGCEVFTTDGASVGRCVAVLDNPAHDMVELDSGALVPMPFVTEVESGVRMVIDPPEGLLGEP
jgi:16S rRNA processing protein RimM